MAKYNKNSGPKKNVYEIITEKVIEKMKEGVIPWEMPWNRNAEGGIDCPRNFISKKPYRGINIMLTGMAGYRCPFWLTAKQCFSKKGQIIKGEKATMITYWRLSEYEDEKDTDKDGNPKKKKAMLLRYYNVFNLEQTTLADQWEPEEVEEKEDSFKVIERCKVVIDKYSKREDMRITHKETKAYYSPFVDFVNMPSPESFTCPELYYSIAFHELTHSTGHKSRLNRPEIQDISGFGSHSYSCEELTAEMGACFLSSELGIVDRTFNGHVAYLQSWIKQLQNNTKWIVWAAQRAQKASDYVLGIKPESKGE